MALLRDVLVFIHLLGFAALLGGGFVQLRDRTKVINATMLGGILVQVVSGILLVGVIEALDEPIDNTKTAVKFAVALVIAVLCWVNRRKESVPTGLFDAIVLLAVANVGVAVFW